MQNKYLFLRGAIWFVCIFHILLGVILNLPVSYIVWLLTNILGATKMPDASILFLVRMLGTYLFVFGIGMGIAAWNPVKNRSLLTLGAILVTLRAVQRIVQAGSLEQMLGISSQSNWVTIIIFLLFAIALVVFRAKIYKDMKASEVK